MNETDPDPVVSDRMHVYNPKGRSSGRYLGSAYAKDAAVHYRREACAACTTALAGTVAALVLGCSSATGGASDGGAGDSSYGVVGSARSAQNIERHHQIQVQQQVQRQQVLEARREAAIEQQRQRQITQDRAFLQQQEQEKAKQAQQQANQGKHLGQNKPQNIPPGQAKKQ